MKLRWICAIVLVLAVGLMAGCPNIERMEAARDQATALAEQRRQDAEDLRDTLAQARQALDEARTQGLAETALRIEQQIETIQTQIAVAETTAASLEEAASIATQAIADAQAGEGLIENIPGLSLVPPPYREGALLIGGTALALWRNRKLRAAATSLAQSFQQLRTMDPLVDASIKQHAKELTKAQTPTARKLVDEVQGKRDPVIRI